MDFLRYGTQDMLDSYLDFEESKIAATFWL